MLKRKFDPLDPPARWLNCPRKANDFIADKFLAFKTPLSSKFDGNVPPESRFNIQMLLNSMKNYNKKLGFIIDLTNTNNDRYYEAEKDLKPNEIKYMKIRCAGHDETPTEEQTRYFVTACENFQSRHPLDIIGVHCTHGFNRTGFMICAYLVEKLDFSIDAAIMCFARVRPPGIYKQEYVDELFKRYASPDDDVFQTAERPDWDDKNPDDEDNDESDIDSGNSSEPVVRKKRKHNKEHIKANPEFAEPISGVEPLTELTYVSHIQKTAQEICKWEKAGFPGSQPVSMDMKNLQYLETKDYRVSWKADGTRYLMLILGRDKVFMLDRDNSVFHVHNLNFPKRKEVDKYLQKTLLDGEFVMDINPENEEKMPRFLVYDIVSFEEHDIGSMNFPTRLLCIEKEIIQTRHEAFNSGRLQKSIEPFSIRLKPFFPLTETKKLLSEDFKKQLSHGIDGLIFQPADDRYTPGMCEASLKWKPPSMNSVDFKLIIRYQNQPGMLQEDCEIGDLYVGGYDSPFSTIKLTKSLRKLSGKIVECNWNNGKWEFMRERFDKSYPNAVKTAVSVCESIKNPVTEEKLIEIINRNTYASTKQKMPPPPQHLKKKY